MLYVAVFCFIMFEVAMLLNAHEQSKQADMAPEERRQYLASRGAAAARAQHGAINPAMICPHCGERGAVRTKPIDRKKGVSGGKATAAVLTGGVSMLAVGLSRKEHLTRARCDHCFNSWDF